MVYEHYKGEENFVKKVIEWKQQSLDYQMPILTPFLNPREQTIVNEIVGTHELQVLCFGGFIGAESQRIIMAPTFYELGEDDFEIEVCEVIYRQEFSSLQHKDLLGAIMNQGIKRELIGDIVVQDKCYIAMNTSISSYIKMNLTKVKNATIKLKPTSEAIEIERQYTTKTLFVSSFRLDKVVSALYKVPRSEASQSIRAGFVKVNHKPIEDVAFLCHNNDVISFKKHGRVKLVNEQKQSKQGNHVISGYYYK